VMEEGGAGGRGPWVEMASAAASQVAEWVRENPILVAKWLGMGLMAVIGGHYLFEIFIRPLERVRHIQEVGYCNPENADAIAVSNDVRKRRDRGNIPPAFPNGWYCVLYSRELAPLSARSVSALGQTLAVFRGHDKSIHVLDAYCPHLGANLAEGGKVVIHKKDKEDEGTSCLQCPFHGWTFSGESGQCMEIPYSDSIPSNAKTKVWESMEINGQILIWFDAEGRPPQWRPPAISGIEDGSWTCRGKTQHVINAHIQEVPENGADVPHLNFLHSPIIAVGTDLRHTQTGYGPSWAWIQHTWDASWVPGKGDKSHVAVLKLDHGISLFGIKLPPLNFNVVAYQVGPSLVYLTFKSFFGEGAFVQSLLPLGPMEQKVTHEVWGEWTLPTIMTKFFLLGEAIQVERDVMIWNNKRFNHKPALTKGEGLILQFRRWYSQFYSEHSREVAQKTVNYLDW